jgi:hypothetical protein
MYHATQEPVGPLSSGLRVEVAMNIQNKQSQKADKGCYSSKVFGVWLAITYSKKYARYKLSERASDLCRFFG